MHICINLCIGLALNEIKHPAITICSQGVNQQELNVAIKRQFERFALEKKNKNLTGHNYRIKRSTTNANAIFDAKSLWKEYVETYYPGSEITPNSLVHILIASNPDKALRAKTLTNVNSVCVNAIDCSTPIEISQQNCGCDCKDPALVPGNNSSLYHLVPFECLLSSNICN